MGCLKLRGLWVPFKGFLKGVYKGSIVRVLWYRRLEHGFRTKAPEQESSLFGIAGSLRRASNDLLGPSAASFCQKSLQERLRWGFDD